MRLGMQTVIISCNLSKISMCNVFIQEIISGYTLLSKTVFKKLLTNLKKGLEKFVVSCHPLVTTIKDSVHSIYIYKLSKLLKYPLSCQPCRIC